MESFMAEEGIKDKGTFMKDIEKMEKNMEKVLKALVEKYIEAILEKEKSMAQGNFIQI